ncbi:MAG: NAD(P)-dependent alcohol dehydrogenase [Armatimonadetes bacterium]|nr:NAD(P)-dependent alcohol dehydrogenase [Anaerolineae bacterium]
MRAVGFRQYGAAEVLETLDMPKPSVDQNSVLIRVVAASVNPSDPLFRSGALKLFIRIKLPFVPGLDVAGVVEAVGSAVTRFRPGDAVYAMLPNTTMGGYAEYAAMPESSVAPLPTALTFSEAASLPCAAMTALQALRDEAQLKLGMSVLVNGASGGVGMFGVQIAKLLGAHVTATCSTRNLEFVRGLGADVVLDYTQTDITAGGAQYDIVFDAVGVLPFGKAKAVIRPGGVMVTVNFLFASPPQKFLARFDRQRRQLKALLVKPVGADLETLNAWIAAGKLRTTIDTTYAFTREAVMTAHQYSESKRVRGKLVLTLDTALAVHKPQG